MKKFFFVFFIGLIISCSSDDSSSGGGTPTSVPMSATIDSQSFSMEPEVGGDLGDPSGGMYGSDYYELEGYKEKSGTAKSSSAKVPTVNFEYYVRLAIPKINKEAGTYNFTGPQLPNGYYADLDVIIDGESGEAEETLNGSVVVTSYDSTTKRIKGTFQFTTSDGVSATQTHSVSGSFNYILD